VSVVTFCSYVKPDVLFVEILRLTGLWVSGGWMLKRTRVDEGPLQPFDGRREASDRKQMAGRNPDGADASRRVIDLLGG